MSWNIPATFSPGEQLLSADLNAQLRDNLNFLKLNIALEEAVTLVINTGAVTKSQSHHVISGGGSPAELDTINGGAEGNVLLIRPSTDVITVKNGAGNIVCGNDITLDNVDKYILLIFNGTNWDAISGGGSDSHIAWYIRVANDDPSNPNEGDIYFNTADHSLRVAAA